MLQEPPRPQAESPPEAAKRAPQEPPRQLARESLALQAQGAQFAVAAVGTPWGRASDQLARNFARGLEWCRAASASVLAEAAAGLIGSETHVELLAAWALA